MAQIKLLDKNVAELIAAGEVVERPSSVIKELVENAVDAGAAHITVSIENGGITFMQIQDDGTGIPAQDVQTAFMRHATSKISQASDLEALHTLGFRGEALASIAAVADVELLTKTADELDATKLRIKGGEVVFKSEAARPNGTTITVSDLFYNTPARMKFLKKDATEAGYIQSILEKLALSHPEIAVRFLKDGKQVFATQGDGALLSAITSLFDGSFSKNLLPVNYDGGNYTVSGYVTQPHANRGSRVLQHTFINGRYVNNKTVMAALEQAYRGLTMVGRFPGCALNITMPATAVDVNVHPAKTEVRFANEKVVFEAVYRAVKQALAAANLTDKKLELSSVNALQQKEFFEAAEQTAFSALQSDVLSGNNADENALNVSQGSFVPYYTSGQSGVNVRQAPYVEFDEADILPHGAQNAAAGIENLKQALEQKTQTLNNAAMYVSAIEQAEKAIEGAQGFGRGQTYTEKDIDGAAQNFAQNTAGGSAQAAAPTQTIVDNVLEFKGEVFKTYIIAQYGSELCFIDKHAAHERLIYEQIKNSFGDVEQQILLSPEVVLLTPQEKEALLGAEELVANAGFEVDDFGGNSVVVRAVPANLTYKSIEVLIGEVARNLLLNPKSVYTEKLEWVLHSIACRAAIKGGDNTVGQQLFELAKQILSGAVPQYCPHGRPVVLRLSKKDIEKQFGR